MGRLALMLVVGLAFEFGILANGLQHSFNNLAASEVGYYKYSCARNLARTAIHATLRAYDRNAASIPTGGSFNDGSYGVDVSSSGDTLKITSTGFYWDSTYTMKVKLLRTTKPFPTTSAAIGIRATPVAFSMSGHPTIDGHNYDITGSSLVGSGDQPGVMVMDCPETWCFPAELASYLRSLDRLFPRLQFILRLGAAGRRRFPRSLRTATLAIPEPEPRTPRVKPRAVPRSTVLLVNETFWPP